MPKGGDRRRLREDVLKGKKRRGPGRPLAGRESRMAKAKSSRASSINKKIGEEAGGGGGAVGKRKKTEGDILTVAPKDSRAKDLRLWSR